MVLNFVSHLMLLNKNAVHLSFQNLEVTKKFILCFTSPQFLHLSETYSDVSFFLLKLEIRLIQLRETLGLDIN